MIGQARAISTLVNSSQWVEGSYKTLHLPRRFPNPFSLQAAALFLTAILAGRAEERKRVEFEEDENMSDGA